MAITRWDPFNDLRALSRRFERAMEPMYGNLPFMREAMPLGEAAMWPVVDVYEDKEEIVFRAELPGMEQKDVDVRIEDSTLTFQGNRRLFKEEKKENYQRVESSFGHFSRSFSLPSTIDRERIRAEMKGGVLEVHVPKREGARGKSIPIQ
ncbi:MAG TPA: Hsp20/alpha crystallin family protein [Vulgatibacter sp.]